MSINQANHRSLAVRRTACLIVGGIVSTLALTSPATARTIAVVNQENPNEVSSFTLDFGAAGGIASSLIARTDYELQVDPDAATARFASYYQEVDPLILPGGFSTGNIIIEVVDGSSAGTFDVMTGEFTTSEVYAIHFDGDLSAFELESPVLLPGSSSGTIQLDGIDGGSISMAWDGASTLRNPFDPSTEIGFTYTCSVNTVFAAEPTMLVRLALIPEVISLDLNRGVENGLVVRLIRSSFLIDSGHQRAAIATLGAVIHSVQAQSGRRIDVEDADLLSDGAEDVIMLLRPTGASRAIGKAPGLR